MDFVKDAPCTEYGADLPQALAADGRPLRRYGRQHITFYTYNGQTIIANFEVLDVTGPSMAVGKLQERGYVALFGAQSHLAKGSMRAPLVKIGGLFFLTVASTSNALWTNRAKEITACAI